MSDGRESLPNVPPFGIEKPSFDFALWLRDELSRRPGDCKEILADIADVVPDTITAWAKGPAAGSKPSLNKACAVLTALDGWPEFLARLEGRGDGFNAHLRSIEVALRLASDWLPEHPDTDNLSEALDRTQSIARQSIELAQRISAALKQRQSNRASESATPRLVPRDAG